MRQLLNTLRCRLAAGEDVTLVTVTAATGATPRGAGARMLVGKHGRICGTIGGGAVEYRSEQLALEVLAAKASVSRDFSLTREDVQELGMICGGACNVFFHYIPAGDPQTIALTEEAEGAFVRFEDRWLVCDLNQGGQLTLVRWGDPRFEGQLTRRPHRVQEHGEDYLIEQLSSSGRVYVFGGGHVAQELVPVLSHVGFRCVVMDNREAFAKKALFPTAEEVILGDFTRIGDYVSIGREDYVCVMTRGHASDTLIQAQVLRQTPCYCGVIGSAAKAAGVRKALKEIHGLSDDLLDNITTPIGLKIHAETPGEIAISIAAQMIARRAERSAGDS